ncbi:hypothetical protein [Bacillus toyonensis]|uniref:hypothetical protein n=1 Tax=Bacillus toyonensis TaxID=155322 RepID=UPI002E221EDE|nr:hypothetical protein [Bacillus toyonensis]
MFNTLVIKGSDLKKCFTEGKETRRLTTDGNIGEISFRDLENEKYYALVDLEKCYIGIEEARFVEYLPNNQN